MKKKQKTGHSSSAFYGIFSLLLCISVLALVLVFANSKGTAATDRTAETFCSVYIEEGDSLWSMASQYAPEGMDVSEYIQKVRQINHLKTNRIMAGESIILPIYTEIPR